MKFKVRTVLNFPHMFLSRTMVKLGNENFANINWESR